MKRILTLLIAAMTLLPVWAQGGSGAGYDPSNPPEPNTGYRLTTEASPAKGGTVSPQRTWAAEGQSVYIEAYAKLGYEFRAWMQGDSVVSTSPWFYYEMPAEAVKLTAWFDKVDYNPANPGEPFEDGYTHRVNIYCTPSTGGWVSNNNFLLTEGQTTSVYAYNNSNFKFECWKQDGKIVSTDRYLEITMGEKNLEYTAQFSYAPESPADPNANSWNKATGELIIDNFRPGDLWSAIYSKTDGHYEDVATLKVIGRMDAGEYSVARNLPNLTEADFSRTSGASQVLHWAFENCQSLTRVLLPADVTELYAYSFYGCPNLSEIVVYAAMPPVVDYWAFYEVPENLVVKVYSGSRDLYQNADVWGNYKIMTIDEDSTALSVTLPDDAADGRYRNASLQLNNYQTGQSQKLVITGNRVKYIFGNLIPDMKYGLYVLAPNGAVIGKYLDFELPKEGLDYKFESLLQLHNVTLSLLTPDGDDVASRSSISWFDEGGKFIGSGDALTGLVEGTKVAYQITIPQDLGVAYQAPANGDWTVAKEENVVKIELKPFEKVKVSGTLTDGQLNEPIAGGYVTVTQTLNGQYPYSATAVTDKDGKWLLEVIDAPGKLTAGSPDHMEENVEFLNAGAAQKYAGLTVKPVFGTELNLSLLCRENILPDEKENEFSDYEDYANVDFKVENLTQKKEIRNTRLRWPRLMLLDEVKDGDLIRVTGTPRNSAFNAAVDECNVTGDKGDIKLAFTRNGDIAADYGESEAAEVVALLYNAKGVLVSKTAYAGNTAAFKGLPTGTYTLVTMASSRLFSAAGTLKDLESSLLEAGKDYLAMQVTVKDGFISAVHHDSVPVFDEAMFYYTTPETSVTVNKSNVTVGAFVTVRSKVEFLPEYADKIEKVKIVFTIPEGCRYVDNSLLVAGEGANFTVTDGGRLAVDVYTKDASPRFCIIPMAGGEYRPAASIEFEYDGQTITQPIGSALFTAGDFSLSVPEVTSIAKITARGAATALSEVKVYDNDVFVGSARTLTNGDWHLTFDLINPGEYSEHLIRAEITTPEGVKYNTTTETCVFEKDYAELLDIFMIYGGTTVDFNHVDGTTVPGSYSYVPGNEMFTFKAVFRGESALDIESLNFQILLSDGSTRIIDGKLLTGQKTWVCALGFPDVNRLPVNIKVIDKRTKHETKFKAKVTENYRCPNCIPIIDPSGYVYEAVASNRVEGVMATIYYKELKENMYGEVYEDVVKWDAEAYAQQNPLFTDAEGMYQWDVPQGEWMVKFEKEGYEAAQTAWLPVPPPQLDVNVGITQTVAPQVVNAKAYGQAVEVTFDKYMMPSTLTDANIAVTVDETAVSGTISLIDAEEAPDGETYARAIRFEAEEPFSADEVTLTVSPAVKSYAGIAMGEAFVQEFTVEPEIESIEVETEIEAYVDEPATVKVTVLPAKASAGKTLLVSANTPIASYTASAVIDDNGEAVIDVTGELPGTAVFTFTVRDENVTPAECAVTFDVRAEEEPDPIIPDPEPEPAEAPTSSVASGTELEEGVSVELSSTTPGAQIYYTVDGTSPVDSETRKLYDGPIAVTEDMTILAVTEAEGYLVSEIAEFNYTVNAVGTIGMGALTVDVAVDGGAFTVNGCAAYVTVSSTNGSVAFSGNVEAGSEVALDAMVPGVYVLNAVSGSDHVTVKFIKR